MASVNPTYHSVNIDMGRIIGFINLSNHGSVLFIKLIDNDWSTSSTAFEYNGLYSHNPFFEPYDVTDFDFTPEQLKSFAAAVKEKDCDYQYHYGRALCSDLTPKFKEPPK